MGRNKSAENWPRLWPIQDLISYPQLRWEEDSAIGIHTKHPEPGARAAVMNDTAQSPTPGLTCYWPELQDLLYPVSHM